MIFIKKLLISLLIFCTFDSAINCVFLDKTISERAIKIFTSPKPSMMNTEVQKNFRELIKKFEMIKKESSEDVLRMVTDIVNKDKTLPSLIMANKALLGTGKLLVAIDTLINRLSGVEMTPKQRLKRSEELTRPFDNESRKLGKTAYDLLEPSLIRLSEEAKGIVAEIDDKVPETLLQTYENTIQASLSKFCDDFSKLFVQQDISAIVLSMIAKNYPDQALQAKMKQTIREALITSLYALVEKYCDLAEKFGNLSPRSPEQQKKIERFFEYSFFPLVCFNLPDFVLFLLEKGEFERLISIDQKTRAIIEKQFGIKDWRCQ